MVDDDDQVDDGIEGNGDDDEARDTVCLIVLGVESAFFGPEHDKICNDSAFFP